jgi:hypothetical protein
VPGLPDQARPGRLRRQQRRVTGHQACGCRRSFLLPAEHLEWLVTFEDRGLAGVVDLIAHFDRATDGEHEEGTLGWVDLRDFVGMHSWRQPAEVWQLAQVITDRCRRWSDRVAEADRELAERNRARSVLRTIVELATMPELGDLAPVTRTHRRLASALEAIRMVQAAATTAVALDDAAEGAA